MYMSAAFASQIDPRVNPKDSNGIQANFADRWGLLYEVSRSTGMTAWYIKGKMLINKRIKTFIYQQPQQQYIIY